MNITQKQYVIISALLMLAYASPIAVYMYADAAAADDDVALAATKSECARDRISWIRMVRGSVTRSELTTLPDICRKPNV